MQLKINTIEKLDSSFDKSLKGRIAMFLRKR